MPPRVLRSRQRATNPVASVSSVGGLSEDAHALGKLHAQLHFQALTRLYSAGASRKRVKSRKDSIMGRRKQGRLSALPSLPLDVLYEVRTCIFHDRTTSYSIQIFEHLGPADLLNLARVNKTFRGVLMSKQCAFLWRSVLGRVTTGGYPAMPDPEAVEMSEPAFAQLAYGGPWCSVRCSIRASVTFR